MFVDLTGRTAGQVPIGQYDSAAVDASGLLTMRGWAIDPDTLTDPVPVHLYVDGKGFAVSASESRPDVGAVYPAAGSLHGFTGSVQVGAGTHTACAYAIDTFAPTLHTTLGCRTVTFAPTLPMGQYDSAAVDASGLLTMRGWAIDPDTLTDPVPVHLYVDGKGFAVSASESRPDVGAVYPAAGSLHGFTGSVQVGAGTHTACAYAIDTFAPTLHTTLGCRTVTFAPTLPMGQYDSAAVDASGLLTMRGWAIDPDTLTDPVPVHLYVDGKGFAVSASESRPDVGAVYPAAGSLHGFTGSVSVGPGTHQACAYAIDTSVPSTHTDLGCRTVTFAPTLPMGHVRLGGGGCVGVVDDGGLGDRSGHVDDPVPVHLYVDWKLVLRCRRASRGPMWGRCIRRRESARVHGSVSVGPGTHQACAYAIDTSVPSTHTDLGCRSVTR